MVKEVTKSPMLFRGRSTRSLDPKGRLMMPADFRDALLARSGEGQLVLTTFDNCLVGFPLPEWEEFEEKIMRIKNPSRELRGFRRLIVGGAEAMELDKQGRIRLSQDHRDYAGLGKETVVVGQLSKFEVWNPERLASEVAQDFGDVASELADSGIDIPL